MTKIKLVGGVADHKQVTMGENIWNDLWAELDQEIEGGLFYTNSPDSQGERYWYDMRDKVYRLFEWDIDFLAKDPKKEKFGEIYNSRGDVQDYKIIQAHLASGTITVQLTDLKGKIHIDEFKGEVTKVEIKVWGIPLRFEERTPVPDPEIVSGLPHLRPASKTVISIIAQAHTPRKKEGKFEPRKRIWV